MHQVQGIAYQVLLSPGFDAVHPSNAAVERGKRQRLDNSSLS